MALPSGRVYWGEPCTPMVVCAPVCRSTEMAVDEPYPPARNSAWLPSPDQSTSTGPDLSPGAGKVVSENRLPAGSTRYKVVLAVSRVGAFGSALGSGCSPGRCGVAGLHMASVQPGPTFDHGTSPSAASTPWAAAGVAGAAEVGDDGAGLPFSGCA